MIFLLIPGNYFTECLLTKKGTGFLFVMQQKLNLRPGPIAGSGPRWVRTLASGPGSFLEGAVSDYPEYWCMDHDIILHIMFRGAASSVGAGANCTARHSPVFLCCAQIMILYNLAYNVQRCSKQCWSRCELYSPALSYFFLSCARIMILKNVCPYAGDIFTVKKMLQCTYCFKIKK